jgi:acetolactate synthase small subunit
MLLDRDLKTIHLTVNNSPGVLIRIALVFTRRSVNIESLVVNPVEGGRSQITITALGDEPRFSLIVKQLGKIVDVLKVEVPTDEKHHIQREMMVLRIRRSLDDHSALETILADYRTETLQQDGDQLIVQLAGYRDKLDHCLRQLNGFEVVECIRSGNVVMNRFVQGSQG